MSDKKPKKKVRGPPCLLKERDDKRGSEIRLHEIQSLGLFCILNEEAQGNSGVPLYGRKLIAVHNHSAIESWVMLYLPSHSTEELPALAETFCFGKQTIGYESGNPSWSAMGEIGLLSKKREKNANQKSDANRKQNAEQGGANQNSTNKCTLDSICVPVEHLAVTGFPKEGLKLDSHEGTGEGYAIDCEMCLSGSTKVLTRLAVVRFSDSKVMLDQLIKPNAEISDYVTQFSGITKEMLEGVEFTFEDAQNWMRKEIGRTDILIGHSLESDLGVLQIQHDRVIDTTVLYPHYRGLPYRSSLKYLAKKYLDSDIQQSVDNGHNPVEDAIACLRLTKLILEHGPEFGDVRLESTPLSSYISRQQLRSSIIGPENPVWDEYGTADHIVETDVARCVDATLKSRKTDQLVCCTLQSTDTDLLNSEIRRLMKHMPPRTLVVALVGTGDAQADTVRRLRTKKLNYKREYRLKKWDEIEDPWTTEDDTALLEAQNKLRRGYAYFAVTIDANEIQELPMKVRRTMVDPSDPPSDETEASKSAEEQHEDEHEDEHEQHPAGCKRQKT